MQRKFFHCLNHTHLQHTNNTNAGFTLLELLIALFIFTIVAMIGTSALHTVIRAEEGTERNAIRLRELQSALLLLSREIAQTIDRPIINPIGKEEVSFKGTPHGFTFTHLGLDTAFSPLPKSALERSGYYWEKEGLWRLTWSAIDQPPQMKAHAHCVLHAVTDARFAYLDESGHFHDQWPLAEDSSRSLPKAVRIELNLAGWGKISQTYLVLAEPVSINNNNQEQSGDESHHLPSKEENQQVAGSVNEASKINRPEDADNEEN